MLTPAEAAGYGAAVKRRLTHEPIQYITGRQEFYGLDLHVTPAVLIPRPETELLVEAVLTEIDPNAAVHVADIGTGSGAIAIALAHHLPHAQLTATDISASALNVAAENAARHNLASRIRFIESDLLEPPNPVTPSESRNVAAVERPASWFQGLDAIVSNPPYVPTADAATLHPQVREYEPHTALYAGDDGLSIYRRLIPLAHAALKPNGQLALELGHGQRDALATLLADWHSVRFLNDLQGIPRVALARKP